jgi:hypothetical protein
MFRTKSDRIRRTGAHAVFCADCDQNGTSTPKRSHLDPDVSRYLAGVRSPEATRIYPTVNTAHWDRRGFGIWALRTRDGEFAGLGFRRMAVHGVDEVEIAHTFKRSLWGQDLPARSRPR